MADGDGGDGDDDGEERGLDRFEIGDTIGTPSDGSNGHHEADDETERAATEADTESVESGPAEEPTGDAIPTPRERAEPDSGTEPPGDESPADTDNGETAALRETSEPEADTTQVDADAFDGDGPVFEETQRLRQRWLWAAVLGVSLFSVVTWLFNPTGQLLTVILLGVPAVGILGTYAARLETRVEADGVHIRFFPLHRSARVVKYDDLTGVDSREYDAFGDFGGIGIRRTRDAWAYVAKSGPGVVMERGDDMDVIVTTERPEELKRAVETGLSRSRGVEGGLDERWRAVANFEDSSRIDT